MRLTLFVLGLAAATSAASAEEPTEPTPTTVIVLRPAAAPVPALKYRILPERRELIPGNAAIFYHRGIEMNLQARAPSDKTDMSISEWSHGPLRDIPKDEAREVIRRHHNALHEVELGARRTTCDWEFDRRDEVYDLLIPEIQEMRSLYRLVDLRIRLAILDGETDAAIHWLQVGFAMGRHVSQGPTLIQALVGVAITNQTSKCLEELIQVPGTPSLYWALANRPRPYIDMGPAFDAERFALERELPALREIGDRVWSLDQARRFADEYQRKMGRLLELGGRGPGEGADPSGTPSVDDFAVRASLVGIVAKDYPGARRSLIAGGRTVAQVDAMPTVQVVMLDALQKYTRMSDDIYKWVGFPYWESHEGIDRMNMHDRVSNLLLWQLSATSSPLNSVLQAGVRLDRFLDALQGIEAVRLNAAAHDGALPKSLEAITEVPIPPDPATGKPFEYTLIGDTAIFSAPIPPGMPDHYSIRIRYELKPAR